MRIFTITSIVKHQNVILIFCLTVVSLCILFNPCSIFPQQSLLSTLSDPFFEVRTCDVVARRIFTITSVANHKCILPIYCLTVVSLCILLNHDSTPSSLVNGRHLPLYIVAINQRRQHQCVLTSSYVLSDCSLVLYSPESTPSSLADMNARRHGRVLESSSGSLEWHVELQRIFTITSVANHQSVLPIFCLTVVTLYPPGSTLDLSSPIVSTLSNPSLAASSSPSISVA